jgi:NADH:ubiquinone oxidoreductase subunit 6 (subunit J)
MNSQNERRTVRTRQNSPAGWLVGIAFVVAVVLVVFFYTGRDSSQQTTNTTPANAPSVTTGSSAPASGR